MKLVFLHGPPASGKLTIARELSRLTGLPVFHNHLVVDTLLEVFEFGSPEFVELREQFWLSTFRAAADSGRSVIFTFAPDPTVPTGFPQRAASIVANHAGQVHFVGLQVSPAEQERRIENPDRKRFQKLASVDTLKRIQADAESTAAETPPVDLLIDTDNTDAAGAARQIRDACAIASVDQVRGYRLR